jgi:hypothetical protein
MVMRFKVKVEYTQPGARIYPLVQCLIKYLIFFTFVVNWF